MKKKIKVLYRGISILLVVTMLPFASFADVGLHKVEASPMTNRTIENPISDNGIEDADAFMNTAMDGTVPKEIEDMVVAEDYLLEEDLTVQNLTIETGVLDLNGYTLYIYENLLQTGGELHVNGGRVVVMGDYRIQSVVEESTQEDRTEVEYIQNVTSPVAMSDGVLEVQGDMILHGSFSTVGNHKVLLSGSATQYVETTNGMTFHILELTNTSEEGVVLGDNIAWAKLITNGCKVTTGVNSGIIGYTLENDEEIDSEFILKEGTLDLNGHTMTVAGDFIHNGGTVI